MSLIQPDRINIGAAGVFISTVGLARAIGCTVDEADQLVAATLRLKTIRFPGGSKRYVLLYALETALFELGFPDEVSKTERLVHHELAGVLYGTLNKEMIHERVRQLARKIGLGPERTSGSGRRRRRSKPK